MWFKLIWLSVLCLLFLCVASLAVADCLVLCWTVAPPLPQLINRSSSLLSEINVRPELTTVAWPPSNWSRSGDCTKLHRGARPLPTTRPLKQFWASLSPCTHSLCSPPRPMAPSVDYWVESWQIMVHVIAAAHVSVCVRATEGSWRFCGRDKTPVRWANPAWINALLLVPIFNRLLQ